MLELVRPTFDINIMYSRKLAEDVPEEQMCAQPVAGVVMNHAAFILGHLAWAADNGARLLGHASSLPPGWNTLFNTGAKPLDDRARYPTKEELLSTLDKVHQRLAEVVGQATTEALAQPAPEQMRRAFPSLGHMLLGLMTGHQASHLGQLSAWRRAIGLPSVF